jgi:hypothetical protein
MLLPGPAMLLPALQCWCWPCNAAAGLAMLLQGPAMLLQGPAMLLPTPAMLLPAL